MQIKYGCKILNLQNIFVLLILRSHEIICQVYPNMRTLGNFGLKKKKKVIYGYNSHSSICVIKIKSECVNF